MLSHVELGQLHYGLVANATLNQLIAQEHTTAWEVQVRPFLCIS